MNKPLHLTIAILVPFIAIGVMLTVPPIAQDLTYHDFADKRPLFGIANFGDVAGNLPFIIFGLIGLQYLFQTRKSPDVFIIKGERLLWKIFFIGAFLVGFGSGYYHLNPNNTTLVWDRLPMTIAFMSFFSLVIMERISPKLGLMLAPILLALGIGSVYFWHYTENLGAGDLRPYALVQFLPMLLIPVIFWIFPARYDGLRYLIYALGWYVLAKLLEHFDKAIFALLDNTVSGHTLKHLAASLSVYCILLYIKKRRVISR